VGSTTIIPDEMEKDLFIQLVERAQSGDQASLKRLSSLATDRLRSFYCRLALRDDLREDLVQEVLLEMIRSLKTLRNANRFWPWLFRVAHTKVSNHFRGRRRIGYIGLPTDQDGREMEPVDTRLPGPAVQVECDELAQTVHAAIAELKVAHRSVLVLRVFERMRYAEIAAVTGSTELNARALFFRAKSALRKQLSVRGINKGMFFTSLVVFGKATSPSRAAESEVALAAGSLKVGFSGSLIGVLGTKSGMAVLSLLTTACLLTLANMSAHSDQSMVSPGPSSPTRSLPADNSQPQIEDTPRAQTTEVNPGPVEMAKLSPDPNTLAEPIPQARVFTTIQASINDANNGDVVVVPSGIYSGLGNRDIDFQGKAITLISEEGPGTCIIDCEEKGRGFHFRHGEGAGSVIDGITVRNGRGVYGGAILCEKSTPTIANCNFETNEAERFGGAIYGCAGSIINCGFGFNTGRICGGAVSDCHGSIADCAFVDNVGSAFGGALYNCGGDISGCIVMGNRTNTFDGGGFFLCNGSIRNCYISDNSAGGGGGGISGCDGIITNCIVVNNSSAHYYRDYGGGGLAGCRGVVRNCTIVGNKVTGSGSKVFGCISEDGSNGGGGVWCYGGHSTLVNCIVWGNMPNQISLSKNSGSVEVSYSDIEGGWEGHKNITMPPCFDKADLEGWNLASHSPCINAGDPNTAPTITETDFHGQPRLMGGRIDIGADEYIDTRHLQAYAGPDQYVHDVQKIELSATGSFACNMDKDLVFAWTQINGPPVVLSHPRKPLTSFLPEQEGDYEFTVAVSDGTRTSEPDEITVVVGYNLAPEADAGEEQHFSNIIPLRIYLDGTGSSDPDGDTLDFSWYQVSGPRVDINEPNSPSSNFVADVPGYYVFELLVSDNRNISDVNAVEILMGADHLLLADAGFTIYSANATVQLDGSGSHTSDGGAPSQYNWKQVAGPYLLEMDDVHAAAPTLTGFGQDKSIQEFTFELVVEDQFGEKRSNHTNVVLVPFLGYNAIALENDRFDTSKPTVVFFGVNDICRYSGSMMWDSPTWCERANVLSFNFVIDSWPEDTSPRRYERCADRLITYFSRMAPTYDQPIQTIGLGGGGTAAIDVARRLNTVYRDPRYAINRVTLLCFGNRDVYNLQQTVDLLISHPVKSEMCQIDNYMLAEPTHCVTGPLHNTLNVVFNHEMDLSSIFQWYKNSLTYPDMNVFNDGVVAGAYWSVIGPGWEESLEPGTNRYEWIGETMQGEMCLYQDANQ